jgi:SAM-dependent methyltransferase
MSSAPLSVPRAFALVRDHEDPRSLAARSRRARWVRFAAAYPDLSGFSVLDLGGTERFWTTAPVRPRSLTIVNITPVSTPTEADPEVLVGDATGDLALLGDRHFDLVFSNSVIEHVGGHRQRVAFAKNVQRLGERYWIQTPNRYFPVEPHWLFPGFQFLPLPTRAWLSAHWPFGYVHSVDSTAGVWDVLSTELIGTTELATLFPGANIAAERVGGLAKSLIAWTV